MSRVVPLGYKKEVSTLKAFALAINCRCEMGIGVGQGCSEGTPAGRACKVTLDVFLSFTVPKCRIIEGFFFCSNRRRLLGYIALMNVCISVRLNSRGRSG